MEKHGNDNISILKFYKFERRLISIIILSLFKTSTTKYFIHSNVYERLFFNTKRSLP